ncbi:hypothetical protein [Aquidulcibacter paucihalophilus]|uniref:hypothetical protein n=1 Tax=Aquidulcibacter paucihalophilus TaxID=1978549 RepID=UPI000A1902A6|nr:hypothetical protein [Aquidulcibacter paucihalophilus]
MRGLDLFQERFAAFGDSYALIGGAACHLIFEDLGLAFRATKDLDIVLCAQVVDAEFAKALWAFIQDGGYEIRQRADGKPTYYRFAKPANADFPYMLEIFARPPATLDLVPNQTIIPVPIEDGQYSLSAILLDEDYFGLLRGMIRRIDGVSVLDEYALIPFKAKAWMELADRRDAGEAIDNRNIVKHLHDVFRLMAVLVPGRRLILPEQIRNDIAVFCDRINRQAAMNPRDFGLALNLQDSVALLEQVYSIRT